jgi:hypothetical protein
MIESKAFYRKIEHAFAAAGESRSRTAFAQRLAPSLLEHLGPALGLVAVHLHERRGSRLSAAKAWGEGRPDLHDELATRLASEGDRRITELPWVGETSNGRTGLLAVGGLDGPLLALYVHAPDGLRTVPTRTELLSALNSIVYAVQRRLERGRLETLFEEARAIQLSLLPPGRREFAGFDVFATSVPAQTVGGDLYDYHEVDDETLGLAVADASGHGFPAALQARDVATGLRMGVERDLKITRMVERLNRVIHQSGLTSRFISLFFGELERNGNLSYINAGHPPPLLLDSRGIRELSVGGMLLGPDPGARYKMGFVHVDRGATLLAYTDGVLERENAAGEAFGLERLGEWLRGAAQIPCEDAVADLMQRLGEHGEGRAFEDDVTILMVHRT